MTKFSHQQSKTRFPQYQCTHQVSWKSIDIYLSSRNENTDLTRADNTVKNWLNLPTNNPKPDLHNINAHTKFGDNPLTFTQVIVRKRKYGRTDFPTFRHLLGIFHVRKIPNSKLKVPTSSLRNKGNSVKKYPTCARTHGQPTWYHNTPPLSCGGV